MENPLLYRCPAKMKHRGNLDVLTAAVKLNVYSDAPLKALGVTVEMLRGLDERPNTTKRESCNGKS